jgi:Uma2 family endonuclease
MATEAKPFLTPEDYLRIERAAEYKSEYYQGEMFAMAGTTVAHSRIVMNVSAELVTALKGKSCQAFDSNLRVHVPATGLYTYPDVSAVCEKPQLLDKEADTLLNPILIVEVLSKSTQSYDRGDKFKNYRSIPSLREYLLIEQDQILVEQWFIKDGHWTLAEYNTLDAAITLVSLDIRLALADVYRDIEFRA